MISKPAMKTSFTQNILKSANLSLLLVLLLSLVALPGLCATYYVDSVSGSDNNNGLSAGSPWRTLARVNSAVLAPADNVLLRRGSIWREQLTLKNSGSAGSPIRVGTYDEGLRPVIAGSDTISSWATYGNGLYSTYYQSRPANVYVDQNTVLNAQTSIFGVSQPGSWFFDGSSNQLYVKLSDGSSPSNHVIEASVRPYGIYASRVSYITIDDIEIRQARNSGILVERGSEYWTISNCFIHNVSEAGIYVRSNDPQSLRGWIIQNNTIGRIDNSPVLDYDRAGILVRGTTGAVVQGNHVDTLNKFGIRICNYPQGGNSYNALVADNVLGMNQGNISIAFTDRAVVTRNTISSSKGYGIGVGKSSDVEVSYNTIQGLNISDDMKLYNGIDINAGALRGNVHHNNVVGVAIFCLTLEDVDGDASDDWVIRNNIFDARNNSNTISGVEGDVVGAVMIRPLVTRFTFASNNYVPHERHPRSLIRYHGSDYSFDAWISLISDPGSISSDPLFVNPGAGNLKLQPGSPCTLRRSAYSTASTASENKGCGRYPF